MPQLQSEQSIRSIQFIDLKAQQHAIRQQVDAAIARVLDHGIYIMGPEVKELEAAMSAFCGVRHSISCANGTDALGMCLMAKNVGPGDAVFVPSFTFAATAEVVSWVGATPVFIDSLPDTFNMDPLSLRQGIEETISQGLKPVGIVPVDLFGQPADYDAFQTIADQYDLWVMADAAQSFGGSYKGRKVGAVGDFATTSFFPAKPLGCYGDGGAIFTDDDDLAARLKSIRVHGQGVDKYDNVRVGVNGRLDTIQAAILLEKMKIFPTELAARQKAAERYNAGLRDIVTVPQLLAGTTSAWAQYTVILPHGVDRAQVMDDLKAVGVPTMIYYIKPLHLQKAYDSYPVAGNNGLPVCEDLAARVLSLPMSGWISNQDIDYIIARIKDVVHCT